VFGTKSMEQNVHQADLIGPGIVFTTGYFDWVDQLKSAISTRDKFIGQFVRKTHSLTKFVRDLTGYWIDVEQEP